MSKSQHSVKLIAYDSVDLDRLSYSNGDVVYDDTNKTLRVMDGASAGGIKIASQRWVQNSAGTIRANIIGDIYNNTGQRVLDNGTTLANPTFFGDIYSSGGQLVLNNGTNGLDAVFVGAVTGNVTGNLTGNVTGNLTGNVTGNLTGNVTGVASSASKLAVAVNINGVAFDGSAAVTVPADASTLTNTTLNSTVVSSSLTSVGTLTSLTVSGTTILADTSASTLQVTSIGDMTPGSGAFTTVSASADITANANVVIPTLPTSQNHATNKRYVDAKAAALSIALGG